MTEKVLERLEKLDLELTWEKEHVRYATFPLSPEEWCSLCMRDGEHYVGGCCGQTGAIQDHFNMIFRDSGGAQAGEIIELMKTASLHDGFELYKLDFDQAKLDRFIDRWEYLTPTEKIGVCCQAVKDILLPEARKPPLIREEEPEDFVGTLQESLTALRYQDMFFNGKKDDGQLHGNREVLLARILPACRALMDTVVPLMSKPFSGYAIMNGPRQIMKDNLGFCIYREENEARKMLEMWKSAVEESKKEGTLRMAVGELTVSRISVDARGGILWPQLGDPR